MITWLENFAILSFNTKSLLLKYLSELHYKKISDTVGLLSQQKHACIQFFVDNLEV